MVARKFDRARVTRRQGIYLGFIGSEALEYRSISDLPHVATRTDNPPCKFHNWQRVDSEEDVALDTVSFGDDYVCPREDPHRFGCMASLAPDPDEASTLEDGLCFDREVEEWSRGEPLDDTETALEEGIDVAKPEPSCVFLHFDYGRVLVSTQERLIYPQQDGGDNGMMGRGSLFIGEVGHRESHLRSDLEGFTYDGGARHPAARVI